MRYIREPFDSFCKVINDKNQHELFAADEKCRLLEAELEQKRKKMIVQKVFHQSELTGTLAIWLRLKER